MKSISDLNAKWWYRLVKVLYGLFFLCVALISALIVYGASSSHEEQDWGITCLYGNHSSFNAHTDKGISISDYDPNKAVPPTMDAQIKDACGITQADIDTAKADAAVKTAQMRAENNCGSGTALRGFLCGLSISSDTYRIGSTWIPVQTPGKAVGFTVLDLLIVLAVFEIGRRTFYYITLGKVRPSK